MRLQRSICIVFTLLISACSTLPYSAETPPTKTDTTNDSAQVVSYFNEVAFGSEFGSSNNRLRKWQEDVKIYVAGDSPAYLAFELSRIIKELNELIQEVKLYRVDSRDEANYVIYLGKAKGYEQIEPHAKSKTKDNWGLFWVYWNSDNTIHRGSMYVDTHRTESVNAQKHLLREELTQSLGLMNDSYRYKDSIFFQKWSYTNEFSAIDKRLIQLLYHPEVKAGMTKEAFKSLMQSGFNSEASN